MGPEGGLLQNRWFLCGFSSPEFPVLRKEETKKLVVFADVCASEVAISHWAGGLKEA